LHVPDPVVPLDASIDTLANLRSEGKIRLVGLSNVTVEHIERARKIVPIVSVQNRYSFADREWDNVVDYCESNGIAFIPWFPLGAGRVAGRLPERIAKGSPSKAYPDRTGVVAETVPDYAAHPRDFVNRASRGKHTGGIFTTV
jgi:aryl-alcohol dehydrogenase-like predicted oxidoreductase